LAASLTDTMALPADANITIAPSARTSTGGLLSAGPSLPSDLLDRSRDRARIAALVLVGMWLFVAVMNDVVARFTGAGPGDLILWGTRERILAFVGLLSAVALWWAARTLRDRPELVLDLGLAFEVVTALLISLISDYHPREDPQAISWVCVTIVLWPAIVPSTPRKTLIASLAAATTVPLAIFLGRAAVPQPDQSFFLLLWFILPPYVCAILAVVPATVIRGLGRQVRKARELGSYELEEQIGKGGMGEVYRAHHRLLARPAAVKLISPSELNSSADQSRVVTERFRREAEAAATLRSPHTIELYDYGVAEDGTFYYVMELLDGIDFHELVRKHGPVPPERVGHLLTQACDSLGEAHLLGLVHRDVKPSNILACRMGLAVDYVKVLDFGLVKKDPSRAEPEPHITSAGAVSGTPAFMAPESVTGTDAVTAAADVYALGCVGYWLLTGQNVFSAANATMMMVEHIQKAPVPPSFKSPQPVPRDLDELIMRCLAKDPSERPSDAAVLHDELSRLRFPVSWSDKRAHEWWQEHRAKEIPLEHHTGSIVIQ
jgi:tRNA A-37 threonylcarbamoyl transferase component Bud32